MCVNYGYALYIHVNVKQVEKNNWQQDNEMQCPPENIIGTGLCLHIIDLTLIYDLCACMWMCVNVFLSISRVRKIE